MVVEAVRRRDEPRSQTKTVQHYQVRVIEARYPCDIVDVGHRLGFQPAETGRNRGPYQPSD